MSESNCSIYSTNPLLKDVKTKYDQDMQSVFCAWAQKQETGPNPINNQQPTKFAPACAPFKSLSTAYEFSGAPSQMNRKPVYNL
jgi:hypothetical protein